MLDGSTPVSYWAGSGANPSTIYLSDHPQGLNGQGTAWHTTSGSFATEPSASTHTHPSEFSTSPTTTKV